MSHDKITSVALYESAKTGLAHGLMAIGRTLRILPLFAVAASLATSVWTFTKKKGISFSKIYPSRSSETTSFPGS